MYARLKPGLMFKSVVTVTAGGLLGFVGLETAICNEKFYAQWLMPCLHWMFEPEKAHQLAVAAIRRGLLPVSKEMRREYAELEVELWGRKLKNCVGLAAGFDKQGQCVEGLCAAGFGFVEVGTVTPVAQSGNEKPRIFRLSTDQALINRCGFNSAGFGAVLEHVKRVPDEKRVCALGVNVGKNKDSPDYIADYTSGVQTFADVADFLVINVSSPNTPGLRELQRKDYLDALLKALVVARQRTKNRPPVLLKVSPDMSMEQKRDVAMMCLNPKYQIDGLVISNTTVSRPDDLQDVQFKEEVGGLSGAPLRKLSTQCIRDFYTLTKGLVPIIGCGGVSSGEDAYEKLKAGASAVQLYTAFTYQGLPLIGRIKRQLVQCLLRDGHKSVADVIGIDCKEQNVNQTGILGRLRTWIACG